MSDFALELRQLALSFYLPPADGTSFLHTWEDKDEEGKEAFGTANPLGKPGLLPR